MAPDQFVLLDHRDGQDSAGTGQLYELHTGCTRARVIEGIRFIVLDVGDLKGLLGRHRATKRRLGTRANYWVALSLLDICLRMHAVKGNRSKGIALRRKRFPNLAPQIRVAFSNRA